MGEASRAVGLLRRDGGLCPIATRFMLLNHDSYHELGRAAGSAPSLRRPRRRGCAPGWTSPRFGVEQRCSSSDVARRGSREIAEIQPRFSRADEVQMRLRRDSSAREGRVRPTRLSGRAGAYHARRRHLPALIPWRVGLQRRDGRQATAGAVCCARCRLQQRDRHRRWRGRGGAWQALGEGR